MPRRSNRQGRSALPGSPFLTHVALHEDRVSPGVFPFIIDSADREFAGSKGEGEDPADPLREAGLWIAGGCRHRYGSAV